MVQIKMAIMLGVLFCTFYMESTEEIYDYAPAAIASASTPAIPHNVVWRWSPARNKKLRTLVEGAESLSPDVWNRIAGELGCSSRVAVVHYCKLTRNPVPWTLAEDNLILCTAQLSTGHNRWALISRTMNRPVREIEDRWVSTLSKQWNVTTFALGDARIRALQPRETPPWSAQEDQLLQGLAPKWNFYWQKIAEYFVDRHPDEVRHRWCRVLSKGTPYESSSASILDEFGTHGDRREDL
ncbi:MAG: hypothetical protein LBR89_04295 [Holosporales bacterium]|jgi:hypothetical protein|nr:hypothetical protein [Holosporales bacterium]